MENEYPYIGQRVILNHLCFKGDFPGTILQVGQRRPNGHPLCIVRLECQEEGVHNVLYYNEKPEVVDSNLWQICYPREESDGETLGMV